MPDGTSALSAPVLIVGGGPVGLALAGDLGARGIDSILVEQTDGVTDHPRANAQNARSMEFFRRWGIAEAVRAASSPPDFPHTALYLTSLNGHELARFERPQHGGQQRSAISPERPQRCNQVRLDPILMQFAQRSGRCDLRFRTRFERLAISGDTVRSQVTDLATSETYPIETSYVVACCGGKSSIRRDLGLSFVGEPDLEKNINLFLRIPELWTFHDKGRASLHFLIGESGHWAVLGDLDGRELWRLTVNSDEYFEHPERLNLDDLLMKVVGRKIPYEFLSWRTWIARGLVASAYQAGPVFLAGDAAHQNPPNGGFGLNTGLGDIFDLSWKLAATLQGWGGSRLLETYDMERRPVAQRNVRESVASLRDDQAIPRFADLDEDGAVAAEHRNLVGNQIRETKRRMLISDGIALGYVYSGSPICVGSSEQKAPAETMVYEPRVVPGARAPHIWLTPDQSILDFFGEGFTLLDFTDDERRAGGIEGAFAVGGVPFSRLSIRNREARDLYGCSFVLVRPDGHIAWAGDTFPSDLERLVDQVRGA